ENEISSKEKSLVPFGSIMFLLNPQWAEANRFPSALQASALTLTVIPPAFKVRNSAPLRVSLNTIGAAKPEAEASTWPLGLKDMVELDMIESPATSLIKPPGSEMACNCLPDATSRICNLLGGLLLVEPGIISMFCIISMPALRSPLFMASWTFFIWSCIFFGSLRAISISFVMSGMAAGGVGAGVAAWGGPGF